MSGFHLLCLVSIMVAGLQGGVAAAGWTFIQGDIESTATVYGTKGVPEAENSPGATVYGMTWTDSADNLWLVGGFGGGSPAQKPAVMWKFIPAQNAWVWVSGETTATQAVYGTKGVAATGNTPGPRLRATTWTAPDGKLWMFGGQNLASGDNYNDVWSYNTATNLWTWEGGSNQPDATIVYGTQGQPNPANHPNARFDAAGWGPVDGKLWLFGGARTRGPEPFLLSDVWNFDTGTREWTWVKGDNETTAGVFGSIGVPNSQNNPPALQAASTWMDASGDLWLFGGGLAAYNSLWRYEIDMNTWTWMGGSNLRNQPGIYGELSVASAENVPGSRWGSAQWLDADGDVWIYGGSGYGSAEYGSSPVRLGDLWKLNAGSLEWSWNGGSQGPEAAPIYDGAPGFDWPGARLGSAHWQTSDGKFYLFGGFGKEYGYSILDDMWVFDAAGPLPAAAYDWQLLE